MEIGENEIIKRTSDNEGYVLTEHICKSCGKTTLIDFEKYPMLSSGLLEE